MKNIDNNFGGDISKIHGINFERSSSVSGSEPTYSAPEKEIDDLDKAHSALIGRSMVKKYSAAPKFDGKIVASVKSDLAELNANYAKNRKSVAIEDLALSKGISYEQAMKMGEEFRS